MMQTHHETVVSADGTPIAVWTTGSGPTVLAIHGTAADHSAWDPMVRLLAPHATVAAIDRRGRGASGDAEPYEVEREVEDAVAVAAALPGPVHVYGHSFGGFVAVHAAPRIPNLASLVLYEGGIAPPGLEMFPRAFVDELDRRITAGLREEALDLFMPVAGRVAVLPGQGHAAHVTAPELLAQALFEVVIRRAAAAAD